MDGHNLVAVYPSRADAEQVQDRLMEFGIPATDVRRSSATVEPNTASEHTGAAVHERHDSFWATAQIRCCTRGTPRGWDEDSRSSARG
jgi:hypothetical protein